MKKIFPVFLTLIFFSCSSEKDNVDPQLPDNTPESKAEIVDVVPLNDGDYDVTSEGFSLYYSTTRNLDTRSADNEIVEICPFVHDGETLFHIIQKEQGWELTSADMRVPRTPIMSDTGTFDLQELNEPTKIMISDLAERIYELKTNPSPADTIMHESWADFSPRVQLRTAQDPQPIENGYWIVVERLKDQYYGDIGPLITTKWGQGDEWNNCVPYADASFSQRSMVGCVAVAGAQMFHYLHYKLGTPAEFFTAGSCIGHKNDCYFNFTIPSTTAWDAMASNYYDSATARARAGILMGYVGSQVGMDYGATASSAKTKDLVGVFNSWGIHCNYRSYNSDDALESIRQRMPVIIDGFRNRNNFLGIVTYSGGHAWIIDGSRLSTITTTTTYKWVYTGIPGGKNDPYERDIEGNIVGEDPVTVTRTLYEYINYFRCNWGWSGHSSDHLYYHKDDAFTGNDKEYKYDNKMIIGFSVN